MTWMPWIMTQRWAHLLYLHSRVDAGQLQALLPAELEVDTFDGDAWVTLIPLRLEKVHLRDVVPVPTTTEFPELNLRTYVRYRGESGVWFLSLDASSWFSVQIARVAFRLPYYSAAMSFHADDDGFAFSSRRRDDPSVRFEARYRPLGTPSPALPGSINEFLAERYCMFSTARSGRLLRGDISHNEWMIQDVDAEISIETVLAAAGVTPLGDRRMAYSPGTTAVAWPMVGA